MGASSADTSAIGREDETLDERLRWQMMRERRTDSSSSVAAAPLRWPVGARQSGPAPQLNRARDGAPPELPDAHKEKHEPADLFPPGKKWRIVSTNLHPHWRASCNLRPVAPQIAAGWRCGSAPAREIPVRRVSPNARASRACPAETPPNGCRPREPHKPHVPPHSTPALPLLTDGLDSAKSGAARGRYGPKPILLHRHRAPACHGLTASCSIFV